MRERRQNISAKPFLISLCHNHDGGRGDSSIWYRPRDATLLDFGVIASLSVEELISTVWPTRSSCSDLSYFRPIARKVPSKEWVTFAEKYGRGTRTRTRDLRIWNPLLYQLSYTPTTRSGLRVPRDICKGQPAKKACWLSPHETRCASGSPVRTRLCASVPRCSCSGCFRAGPTQQTEA